MATRNHIPTSRWSGAPMSKPSDFITIEERVISMNLPR
ncbi:Uncharacterised protein [Corynebacterium minutissimum]|uniref:Uncharacterized protein n=1 Tax=Corynebacterium minutissimum TaxID=38301 RepID=A0A376CZZ8_9CORY|nr:Uncharacterised protein [Corynebacterium minutissimum]